MPSRRSWRTLLPGLAALAAIGIAATLILAYAGVGSMHGKTLRVYVVSGQANGVMAGSEVWLSGQKVGVVDAIDFLPPSTDTTARVLLTLTVSANDAHAIRRGARATLRAGASILAPVVVYLESGDPGSPAVRAGDTLRAVAQRDAQVAMVRLGDVATEVRPLMNDARAVTASLHGSGTLGALRAHGLAIAPLRAQLASFAARVRGRSAAGSEASRSIAQRAGEALARADSIRALLAGRSSSLGRFRRDTTLATAVSRLHDDLAMLSARMSETNGTLGRLRSDVALADAVASAQREMAALLADVRKRPARYINF